MESTYIKYWKGNELPEKVKISVIIPNYNYARFLPKRIETVVNQSLQPDEILFLDDGSDDDSLPVARELLNASSIPHRIIEKNKNSGSVYGQWQKGLEQCHGDYIWIAEADDAASPSFLKETAALLTGNTRLGLVYTETAAINENNRIFDRNLYPRMHKYISRDKWLRDYENDGRREITEYLVSRNTIPNVSAVLFRKSAIESIGGFIQEYCLSGDWASYIRILENWDIAYIYKRLNYQRFHDARLTNKMDRTLEQGREALRIFSYIQKRFQLDELPVKNFLQTLCYWINAGTGSQEEKESFWKEVKDIVGDRLYSLADWDVWNRDLEKRNKSQGFLKKVHNFSWEKLISKCSMRHI